MQQVFQSNTARVRRSISCYALPSYGLSASDDVTLDSSSNGCADSQAQSSTAAAVDTRSSSHRRTMSRVEDAESIENDNEDQISESRREMYEELRARKETLESNLQNKIAELKAICIREAVCITLHLHLHFFVIASSFIITVCVIFLSLTFLH